MVSGIAGLVLLVAAAPSAFAAGTTQVATYTVGVPGSPYHASFSWTVTNVVSKGTFADGSPWVRVAAGSQLVAVSPQSEYRTTSSGFTVAVNGSAKNPRMQMYFDPQTLSAVTVGKQLFDGRRIFLSGPTNQASLDATFDFAANIGMPDPATGQIAPVPLAPGDVVVTALSRWRTDVTHSWKSSGALPNVDPGRRTAIDRFGVLTVLATAPSVPSFRPPLQWRPGHESSRPAPIPVSSVIANESALLHSGGIAHSGVDLLLTSPTFHDGHGILYQSSQAQYALSADPDRQGTIVYGGNQARVVMRPLLFAATDASLDAAVRASARNRLIQYGIDCYGAAMSLGSTRAGAGQRAAEMKPWILLAGWWLNRAEMRDVFGSIRGMYAGTAVAGLSDGEIGRLLFHEDLVAVQVRGGIGLGAPYHQVWGPGEAYRVTGSSTADSVRLMDAGTLFGQFGRMEIDGARQHPGVHARHPHKYYGCSLRIEGGSGAGSTVYRVVEVGNVNGSIGSYVIVDRPWQAGGPDATSTVRMFPFRNGDFVPGLTSDLGRWYFSTKGQNSMPGVDSLSPVADSYARVSFKALVVPFAALKRLADVTGDKRFVAGNAWNLLAESIGGSGHSLINGQLQGAAPNSERIGNQIWSSWKHASLNPGSLAIVRGWLGGTASTGFGAIDRSRIPGTVGGDAVAVSVTPCDSAEPVVDGLQAIETSLGEDLAMTASSIIHSVGWYSYSTPTAGTVVIDTREGSSFDTRLAVVSDCDGSLLYGFNDNATSSETWSRVTFNAEANVTYLVAVGGSSPDLHGTVMLSIVGPGSSGSSGDGDDEGDDGDEGDDDDDDSDGWDGGDHFREDDGAGYSACEVATNLGEGAHPVAIVAAEEFHLMGACAGGQGGFNQIRNAATYRFVPIEGGVYVASTCGGTWLDTRLAVFADCDAGDIIACSDNAPGCNGASAATFEAIAGREYLIVLGTKHEDDTGAALLTLERIAGEAAARRTLMAVGVSSLPGANGSVTGIKTHDIVLRDETVGAWSMHFDGSDVGLGNFGIDALAVHPDGSLVMSFDKDVSIPGLIGGPSGNSVNRCDLVKFVPSSLGWNTSGQWQFWFDGSDVGVDNAQEDIDALEILADGSLLISVKTKLTAGPLANVPSSSVARFVPTSLGQVTAGSWSLYVDGPDVGLSTGSENIDAISAGPGGRLSFSTTGTFSVPSASGGGADVLDFFPVSLGAFTSGNFTVHSTGAGQGIPNGKLNALAELP
jgi:hypothetical protein